LALTPGTRLGVYEVTAQIGEGGMGEVYRARDTKLDREVALKVLPELFVSDPERVARFQREAKTLASLNHPNIAIIHGLEQAGEVHALVMELVPGEDLSQRIAGGAIPIDEALPIARQIAEALEAAHEQGIIHRDLKPANIKVRSDGTVKVLDFGLAKAMEPAAGSSPSVSRSPTITTPALTHAGVILGTAAYMSPEQAKGRTVDKRSDVWAFGCVLYEMLTGRRAFPGHDVADVLGAVIHTEPAWAALPTAVPPVLGRFLRQCLQKAPAQRVRDMGDVRLALEGAFDPDSAINVPRRRSIALWVAAGLVLTAIASGLIGWSLSPAEIRSVSRFAHVLPNDRSFTQNVRPLIAVSPDGSSIVYVASNQLYRRAVGDLEAMPIRGTEGTPSGPFFSPDGQTLGYWDFAAEQLRAVAIAGGTPSVLARASSFYSATWGPDDAIYYGQENGIWRVAARGGEPQRLVAVEPGERVHGPQLLPDGKTILFSLVRIGSMVGSSTAWDTAQVIAQSLDTGERTVLVRGSDARYVPTGHLTYAMGTALFAIPFDVARREITGRPVPIVERVQRAVRTPGSSGSANYDFSRDGTLAYVALQEQSAEERARSLVAVDLTGRVTPLLEEQRDYWRPRISPDGTRVAVEVLDAEGRAQIWLVELERKTAHPFTTEREESFVAWTPDGRSVIYRSRRGGNIGIYRQAADGSGDAELLLQSAVETVPTDVSRKGVLAFAEGPQTGARSIRMLQIDQKSTSEFLDTLAWEHMAVFSPDGRWIAYASDESGEMEVYVRPYPRAPGVGRPVSVGGGTGPVWAPTGTTLFYRGAAGDLMAVPTTLTPGFSAGRPRPMFRFDRVFRMSGNAAAYDIHPDGTRFIMVTELENPTLPRRQINVVENWFEELRRLVPMN
jgi:serine/threonine protein kinase/Tol biopolymer transport system component